MALMSTPWRCSSSRWGPCLAVCQSRQPCGMCIWHGTRMHACELMVCCMQCQDGSGAWMQVDLPGSASHAACLY